MHARVTITSGGNADEENVRYAREKILPQVRSLDGFKGLLDLIDPASGEGLTVTLWESEEALHASEQAASAIRNSAADDLGEGIVDVKRFQVAMLEI